jgi:predicted acetyltransferase
MAGKTITARTVAEDELDEWDRIESAAFGGFPDPTLVALERRLAPLDRVIGAFDGSALVGAAASYGMDMTVPGGNTIPVAGVTAVGVAGTHRRRGALRAMMEFQLDDTVARGEVAAILNASESNIYGRFGYGLAQQYQRVSIRARRAEYDPAPAELPLELVPKEKAADRLRSIFDAYRMTRAGEVSRPDAWWEGVLGDVETWKGGGKIFVVIAAAQGDDPGGYVIYELVPSEPGPFKRMIVRELVAPSAETEAALWRYCTELDLVDVVEVIARPLDDPIRHRLTEPRQLDVVWQADFVWVRLLDIPAALMARSYMVDAELVLEVDDEVRPDVAGRYRLAGSVSGAKCERTGEVADLELSIRELGALYLGGVSASTLALAGRIREVRPGRLELADELFGWRSQPMCTTRF